MDILVRLGQSKLGLCGFDYSFLLYGCSRVYVVCTVTNYHVVRNARSAQVAIISPNNGKNKLPAGAITMTADSGDDDDTFNVFKTQSEIRASSRKSFSPDYQRSVFKAKVVGVDPGKDIAVLKVDVQDPAILQPISVGTSKSK